MNINEKLIDQFLSFTFLRTSEPNRLCLSQSAEIPKHLKHVNLCLYQQTLDISSSSSVAPTISLTEEDLQASSFLEDPSKFEQVKQYKLILEHGIRLFSQKPSKGIQFFKEKGLIEDSLESVAKFLLAESDRLDKTAIGKLKLLKYCFIFGFGIELPNCSK